MHRYQHQQQAGPHQQMAGTPSPMAQQPPEPGSLMQAQFDHLGRGPSGSTPLPTPPPAVAAPLISKSTFNPFESMQRVPFPGGALGGTTGQPTAADPSTPGSQGIGLRITSTDFVPLSSGVLVSARLLLLWLLVCPVIVASLTSNRFTDSTLCIAFSPCLFFSPP
jgi:hypothetical protein